MRFLQQSQKSYNFRIMTSPKYNRSDVDLENLEVRTYESPRERLLQLIAIGLAHPVIAAITAGVIFASSKKEGGEWDGLSALFFVIPLASLFVAVGIPVAMGMVMSNLDIKRPFYIAGFSGVLVTLFTFGLVGAKLPGPVFVGALFVISPLVYVLSYAIFGYDLKGHLLRVALVASAVMGTVFVMNMVEYIT